MSRLFWPAVCAFALIACDSTARELSWQVRLASPDTMEAPRLLRASIREGGCDGMSVYDVELRPEDMGAAMQPPTLSPGTYGFSVVGIDADCTVYAEGCLEVELPREDETPLLVELEPVSSTPECGPSECFDGVCSGGMDASVERDARPPLDAPGAPDGSLDAELDAGFDAGLVCDEGQANCNLDPADGCEVTLGTVDDCRSCGERCSFPYATPVCGATGCERGACDEGWGDCDGDPTNGCETSLRTLTSCGACATPCELRNAASSCSTGTCEIASCHEGFADCDGDPTTGCESSLQSGRTCTSCDSECSVTEAFCAADSSPSCVAICPTTAPDVCGSSCVDVLTNAEHCGGCDNACTFEHGSGICVAGTCRLGSCDPGWLDCNTDVADGCETSSTTLTDCGACGAPCAAPAAVASCVEGVCRVDSCDDPVTADCDGLPANGCEARIDTPANCGSCDTTCTAGTSCGPVDDGLGCVDSCAPPTVEPCDGTCLDTNHDIANCGGCDRLCALESATEACIAGNCQIVACDSGRADCDTVDATGCEVTLASDADHCGTCDNACASAANATGICVAGECALACDVGFGDCDGRADNGCETPLDTVDNCGSCRNRCELDNASSVCFERRCLIDTCNDGFDDCDASHLNGCEVNLVTNEDNCGACRMRCVGQTPNCCAGACGRC